MARQRVRRPSKWICKVERHAVDRLIAESAFNVTNRTGITGYTSSETTTATADFSPTVIAATSKGQVYTTC